MSNVEITIKIDIKPTETPPVDAAEGTNEGSFRLIVAGDSSLDIDTLEDGLLRTSYPALRDALSQYLEQESQKEALKKSREWGDKFLVFKHDHNYRVDGEIGRFEFGTYDVKIDNKVVFHGFKLFPARKGLEWYQTCGFKEIALLSGVAQRSYRQTTRGFNRCRRQMENGTAYNTLHDNAEVEGAKVINFLEKKSEHILEDNGFTKDGLPEANCEAITQAKENAPAQLEKNRVLIAQESVFQDMRKLGLSEKLVKDVRLESPKKVYENPLETVNIHVDDVVVKKQKEHRRNHKNGDEPVKTKDKKHPKVQNTVVRIEHNTKSFTLTGGSVFQVLLFALGFLLNNDLIALRLLFFTDGQRSLQDTIISFFSWHPSVSLVLDWYHLVKKFKAELSLACHGREIRNLHLKQLLRLLWFGLTDQAIDYLREIPASDIKNAEAIQRLIGYLERNYNWIPCYVLRSKLELPNSNNPVERTNNLVTSRRQKHNGMSWSKEGSHALTALNAVVLNDAVQPWVKNREIPFEFVEKKTVEKKAA